MYANFIIPGSCSDLQLHEDIREQVRKELDPPYEELFDTVEEHVLLSLLEPWTMLQGEDESTYSKVRIVYHEHYTAFSEKVVFRICTCRNCKELWIFEDEEI